MQQLIGTQIDQKNISLSKLLYGLRQELDIYCLIGFNADTLKEGRLFFGYTQKLALESIILSICKIYEEAKNKYSLNSIDGIFQHLNIEPPKSLNNSKLRDFIQKYSGPLDISSPMSALKITIKEFRKKYNSELNYFKTFRNKKVAHSEFGFKGKLPSIDVMEKLFLFGVDFYELISEAIISDAYIYVAPADLRRDVRSSIQRVFQKLGVKDVKMEI